METELDQPHPSATEMIHLVCHRCGVSATMPECDSAERAWSDHMAQHGPDDRWSEYRWTVLRLL